MNNEFTFIHCADIHLGAMPLKLEERYEDFFISFDSVINYAINNNINTILVSGDLLHLKNINSKTLLKTTNILEKAQRNNIEVIVIEGNHDKAFYVDEESWLNYLKEKNNICLLSHKLIDGKIVEIEKHENEYIQVYGVGYLGTSTEDHIQEINEYIKTNKTPNKFTVLMLHAAVGKLVYNELATVKKEIINKLKESVDYVALGHIHYTYTEDDFFFNPGSIERIRLEEKNEAKGFYVVTVNNNDKKVVFVNTDTRKYIIQRVDLKDVENEEDINNYLINFDFDIKKEKSVLCINLHGEIEWNTFLIDFSKIKEEVIKKYDLLYVEINNYINVYSEEEQDIEINFESIEKKEIEKGIKRIYPEDNGELIDQTIKLKNAILDKENPEDVLNAIYQSEAFNED